MNLLRTNVTLKRQEPIRRKVRVGMKLHYIEARRHGTHKRHTVSKNLGFRLRMFVPVCFVDCQWASYRKNNNHLDPCLRIFHGYYFVYSWSAHQIPSFIHRAPCEDVPQSWPNGSFSDLPLLIENVLGLTLYLVSFT